MSDHDDLVDTSLVIIEERGGQVWTILSSVEKWVRSAVFYFLLRGYGAAGGLLQDWQYLFRGSTVELLEKLSGACSWPFNFWTWNPFPTMPSSRTIVKRKRSTRFISDLSFEFNGPTPRSGVGKLSLHCSAHSWSPRPAEPRDSVPSSRDCGSLVFSLMVVRLRLRLRLRLRVCPG